MTAPKKVLAGQNARVSDREGFSHRHKRLRATTDGHLSESVIVSAHQRIKTTEAASCKRVDSESIIAGTSARGAEPKPAPQLKRQRSRDAHLPGRHPQKLIRPARIIRACDFEFVVVEDVSHVHLH